MNIYPAIDLLSGRCVRLYQGAYHEVTQYAEDPVVVACDYSRQGANFLHVVDLDGAKQGQLINLDVIIKINRESKMPMQVGGGIRSRHQVQQILESGITRVILGSVAITQIDEVKNWIKCFGPERIVLAFDVRLDENDRPIVMVHGWQMNSQLSLWELLSRYANAGIKYVLCTDIQRDGTLQGPNINLYQECIKRYPNIAFQASGGVGTLGDLTNLAALPLDSVIVGKALYERQFSLSAAYREVSRC